MADPLISVVIPTHGRPEYLAEAVDSVKAQTYDRWECVVVDDCSPTPVEVPEGVTLVRHPRNRGSAAARNTGLAHCNGELVTFLDDDDWFHPERLQWAVEGIGDARAHVCDAVYVRPGGNEPRGKPYEGDMRATLTDGYFPAIGQTVHRRSDLTPFNPALRAFEDREWWFRMIGSAVFAWDQRGGVFVRELGHPRVTTRSDAATRRDALLFIERHHGRLLARSRTMSAANRRGLAGAALGAGARRQAAWWATRSFTARPSALAVKIAARAAAGRSTGR